MDDRSNAVTAIMSLLNRAEIDGGEDSASSARSVDLRDFSRHEPIRHTATKKGWTWHNTGGASKGRVRMYALRTQL